VYESRAQALHARAAYGGHGGSLVDYLASVGLLGPRLTIAHGVWLRPDEIARLAERGAGVVLNMLSNLKLKSGVAPIPALRAAGVRLALGCDNASCSDVQSMFQAMKLFCLLGAVSDPGPGGPTAAEALRLATRGGAATAGLQDRLGAIRPGMTADLVILDLADPAYLPFNSAARQLVYSETGRGVETVIVGGEPVVRDRRLLTVDEDALRRRVTAVMATVRQDFREISAQAGRLLPYLHEFQRRAWAEDLGLRRFVGGP
ncbi:MAG: amidohydrolase family protein, partial [Candidatus Rokuibacteriota bacterium]